MTHRGRSIRWGWFGAATVPLATALAVAFGIPGASAQDATPTTDDEGRPAHIHAGACAEGELGDIVAPLNNLSAPEGESQGQDAAIVAETSFTNVPLPLDAILADDHAINVHLSTEEIQTYIACGEIGGPLAPDGSLTIGLKQQSDSGFTGIAFLAPNAADPATTDVSVFISTAVDAEVGGGTTEEDTEATPAASGDAEVVDVVMTEWALEMPETLPAGPVTFNLINEGEFRHTILIEGDGFEDVGEVIEGGQEVLFETELEPGTYTIYCPVNDGGHRERGMEVEVTVE